MYNLLSSCTFKLKGLKAEFYCEHFVVKFLAWQKSYEASNRQNYKWALTLLEYLSSVCVLYPSRATQE